MTQLSTSVNQSGQLFVKLRPGQYNFCRYLGIQSDVEDRMKIYLPLIEGAPLKCSGAPTKWIVTVSV